MKRSKAFPEKISDKWGDVCGKRDLFPILQYILSDLRGRTDISFEKNLISIVQIGTKGDKWITSRDGRGREKQVIPGCFSKKADMCYFELIMRLHFAVFCQDARIMDDGKVQMFDPIVGLSSDKKPAVHHGTVVVNFSPEDTEVHVLSLKVRAPYGKEGVRPYKVDLGPAPEADKKIGHIIFLDEIILEEEGEYNVDISIDEKPVISIPFDFTVASSECCGA